MVFYVVIIQPCFTWYTMNENNEMNWKSTLCTFIITIFITVNIILDLSFE